MALETGTLMKVIDKSDVHEKMWAVCVNLDSTGEDKWFTFFGNMVDLNEGAPVRFEFAVKKRDGKTYCNIKTIEPVGDQTRLPGAAPEGRVRERISSAQKHHGEPEEKDFPTEKSDLRVVFQGINRLEAAFLETTATLKKLEALLPAHFEKLTCCENMLGSIIESLPGVASKNRGDKK